MDYLYKFLFVCLFNVSLFYKYNHLSYFNTLYDFIIDKYHNIYIYNWIFQDLLRNFF